MRSPWSSAVVHRFALFYSYSSIYLTVCLSLFHFHSLSSQSVSLSLLLLCLPYSSLSFFSLFLFLFLSLSLSLYLSLSFPLFPFLFFVPFLSSTFYLYIFNPIFMSPTLHHTRDRLAPGRISIAMGSSSSTISYGLACTGLCC